jgi:hypothetical protein
MASTHNNTNEFVERNTDPTDNSTPDLSNVDRVALWKESDPTRNAGTSTQNNDGLFLDMGDMNSLYSGTNNGGMLLVSRAQSDGVTYPPIIQPPGGKQPEDGSLPMGDVFGQLDKDDNDNISAQEWLDRNLRGDSDGDGQLSLAEMNNEFGETQDTKSLFGRLDKNGDGRTSTTELLQGFLARESNDGDEVIDRKEFSEKGHEYPGSSPNPQPNQPQPYRPGGDQPEEQPERPGGDDQPEEQPNRPGGEQPYRPGGEHRPDGGDRPYEPDRPGNNEFVTEPDLSQYESQEHMAFIARLASHDQQLNGWAQPDGPQGTIFEQVLLDLQAGGELNGQSKIFLEGKTPEETDQRIRWFFEAREKSINPETGQIDGRVLSQSIVDTYYAATGHDISESINKGEHKPASTDPEVLNAKGPGSPDDPNFLSDLEKYSGWSKKEIAYDLLWGHAQIFSENGQLTDDGVRKFLGNALNGKDPNTSGLIHAFPEIEQAARRIMNSPNPAAKLDELFLIAQSAQFGIDVDIDDDEIANLDPNAAQNNFQDGESPWDPQMNRLQTAFNSGDGNFISRALTGLEGGMNALARLTGANNAPKDGAHQGIEDKPAGACPWQNMKAKFGGA